MNKNEDLSSCPFCGDTPEFPEGSGTQYEILCDCGHAISSVQVSDFMTIEERLSDKFVNFRYKEKFIERAKNEAIKNWNTRV